LAHSCGRDLVHVASDALNDIGSAVPANARPPNLCRRSLITDQVCEHLPRLGKTRIKGRGLSWVVSTGKPALGEFRV